MKAVIRVRANTLDQATQELVCVNRAQADRITELEWEVERLKAYLSWAEASLKAAQEPATGDVASCVRRVASGSSSR